MSIKINFPGGIEAITSTPAEAAALIREYRAPQAPAQVQLFTNRLPLTEADATPRPRTSLLRLGRFLDVIAAAGPSGATSEVVATSLDIHPKGIGSALSLFEKELKALGFDDVDRVVKRSRAPDGARLWGSGDDLPAAAEAVKRAAAGGSGVT